MSNKTLVNWRVQRVEVPADGEYHEVEISRRPGRFLLMAVNQNPYTQNIRLVVADEQPGGSEQNFHRIRRGSGVEYDVPTSKMWVRSDSTSNAAAYELLA